MYLTLKLLHILSAIVFLGNITTGLFWKAHADRSRDPNLIAHALDGIIASDRWFTIPGVVGIVAFGIGAAVVGGLPLLHTGWLLWALVLFSIAGAAFMAQVAPLQRSMAKLARAAAIGGPMAWDEYRALSRRWDFWGGVALVAPAVVLLLMVFKPHLPSL